MSKNAVPPPAASELDPVSIPSQCVRPGSLKWTWESMIPAITYWPAPSTVSAAVP
jgi:hypothetical protein